MNKNYVQSTKDKLKRAFTSIVTLFTTFSTVLGVYAYYEHKKPELEYQIISNSNVIDLNTNLSKLDVIYDNNSLKKLNKNLRILNVKIINAGSEAILKGFYDENAPLGLVIKDGVLVERPELVFASSSYLKYQVKPKAVSANSLIFSNVIIEDSEYFIIKLLILTPKNKVPTIRPIGKVAGIKNISIVNTVTSYKKTFFGSALEGDIYIQLFRAGFYFTSILLIIALVVLIQVYSKDFWERRKKEQIISKFKKTIMPNRIEEYNKIFFLFMMHDSFYIFRLKVLLNNEEALNKQYSDYIRKTSNLREDSTIGLKLGNHLNYNELLKENIISKEGEKIKANASYRTLIESFADHLKHLRDQGKLNS